MKSKIGEKTTKQGHRGVKGFLRTYPGVVILAALVVLGSAGFGISKMLGGEEVITADNEQVQQEENKDTKEPEKEAPKNEDSQSDAAGEDKEAESEPEKADVITAELDNGTDLILPLKASTLPVSQEDLKDSVDIQEMVGEMQPGDDGKNTNQTASIEGVTPLVQKEEEKPVTDTSKKEDKPDKTETSKANSASLSGKAKNHKNTVNSDTVGWVRVPGTNIDYPVVQTTNNDYYVYKDYNRQYDKNGVIYADYECKMGSNLSANTILYGHNWSNVYSRKVADPSDIMFGQLPSFHTLSFAQEHPFIYFSTTEKDYVWQIFSVFYTETSFNYITASPSKDYYKTIISEALKRSIHDYNVNVTTSDEILTLSTCTRVYGQRSDQRFVVMAKKVKSGTSSTTITSNPNHKEPQF